MTTMRLNSIMANHHIFAGRVNGKPVRLQLIFEGGKFLRLQVGGDGEQMITDNGPLDPSTDLGDLGQIDVADVTASLFPMLQGSNVTEIQGLASNNRRVGVRLDVEGSGPLHFWVDGDELYWGDEATIRRHPWLSGAVPTASNRIQV
jgi:hypothetical protein